MVERETVPSPSLGVIGDMTVPGPRRQSGHVGDCPRPPVSEHGSLETFGGPQRHAIAHLKAGEMVIPNMSSVMLGKSVLFLISIFV